MWVVNFVTFTATEHSEKSGGKRETPPGTSVRDIFVPVCRNIGRDIEVCLPHKDSFSGTGGKRELGEKRGKQEVKFSPNL